MRDYPVIRVYTTPDVRDISIRDIVCSTVSISEYIKKENKMDIFEAHRECLRQCIKEGYYTNLLHSVMMDTVINTADDIKSYWSDFWYELPDSPSIHRTPFNLICSICEGEFDE